MLPIRGFIFDIDGTLLDSNTAHAVCIHQALDQAGFPLRLEEVRRQIGMGMDLIIPKVTRQDSESELGKWIRLAKDECFRKRFDDLQPFHHARELIEELSLRGYRLTVATSASRSDLDKTLRKIGIDEYLRDVTTSDDTEVSKPAPDMIVQALRKLDLPAEQVLMVGDTPYDIEAARRAGVRTIALRSGGWKDEGLAGAAIIFDHAAELLDKIRKGWVPK